MVMLTIKQIEENRDYVVERLAVKHFQAAQLVDQIIGQSVARRQCITRTEAIQAELNQNARSIGQLLKEGRKEEAEAAKQTTAALKAQLTSLSSELDALEMQLKHLVVQLPNLPHQSVPQGRAAADNVEVRSGGQLPVLDGTALPHWELAQRYDIIDFELGVKITGAGFPVYKGQGARLQRALIAFFLDEAVRAGYTEYMPPILVNEDSGFGTGQLPDKEGQMYHATADNFYLIPTAEVPVTNMYRDVILRSSDFPVRMTAYTPCFRREAGSYGKDVRGLNRLHQFDKVELVCLEHPDRSYATLDAMVEHVESLLVKLQLPYRILRLCGGDMSFTSALTYDFEVYSAAQNMWLEVSSVSNFESFQANRLKLRYREEGEKQTRLAHTLNGSALALPRIVAALLENNQGPEGIRIPEALRPYTGFDTIQ